MKAITILAAAVIGTFLGTGIGIAQASSEPAAVTEPAPRTAHLSVQEPKVFVMEEVHIAPAKSSRAVTRGHVRTRTWTCSVEALAQGSGEVKYCRWQ